MIATDLSPHRDSLIADARARSAAGRRVELAGRDLDRANELMRRCEARGLSGVAAWELTLQLLGHSAGAS